METNTNTQDVDALLASAKTENDVSALLKDRDRLLRKKPFTRGGTIKATTSGGYRNGVSLGTKVTAKHSSMKRTVVSQDQYMAELDPYMHTVLFDENIPSICVKTAENGAMEIKFVKSAFPFQQCIMEKQTLLKKKRSFCSGGGSILRISPSRKRNRRQRSRMTCSPISRR